jgi:uncharacterized membrane protein YkoI
MKPPVRLSAAIGVALLLLGAAAPNPAPAQDRPHVEAGAARQIPLSRVLQMLAQKMPGRQLNTRMGDSGGRPTYVIQWQKLDGRVVVVVVDAETGQIIE